MGFIESVCVTNNSRVHFPEEVDIFNKISKPHIFLNINSASPSILIFACIFPAVVQWSYILQEPFNSAGSTATLHKLWEMIIEKERHINFTMAGTQCDDD